MSGVEVLLVLFTPRRFTSEEFSGHAIVTNGDAIGRQTNEQGFSRAHMISFARPTPPSTEVPAHRLAFCALCHTEI